MSVAQRTIKEYCDNPVRKATRDYKDVQVPCITGSEPLESWSNLSPMAALDGAVFAPHWGSTVVMVLVAEAQVNHLPRVRAQEKWPYQLSGMKWYGCEGDALPLPIGYLQ